MEERPESPISRIPLWGALGLVITGGIMVFFLVSVPATRWFLLFSLPLGLVVGGILYLWNRRRS